MGIETKYYTNANEPKSLGLASAAVGQIPKVKAVDSNGVPTEWEATAMPSSGGGGSGSPDAVLYTPQTLTDAQKKQARDNIDAASNFVINVNALSGSEVTVDKTYAQVSEAIKAGKTPIVYILHRSVGAVYLSLFSYYENQPITFSGTGEGEKYPYVLSVVMTAAGSTDVVADRLVEIAEDGTMRQVRMDGDPYSDMEIATKKYVDDHTMGGSPNAVLYTPQTLTDEQKQQARDNVDAAIADFVVNATIQDFPTCTLDKTFNQIQEAISKGKRVFARLNISSDNAFILELLSSTSTEIEFTAFDYNYGLRLAQAYKLVVRPDKAEIAAGDAPTFISKGTLPQVKMAAGPSLDMEIATKKYVDDALAAIVDGTEVSY